MDLIVDPIISCLKGMLEVSILYLRNLAADRLVNLINLEENAETLAREMAVLLQMRNDLMNKIRNLERRPRMKRTHRAKGWLESVRALDEKVRALQDSLARRSTVPERCSFNFLHSNWVLGGEVAVLLKRLREIREQKDDLDNQLVDEAPPDSVVPIPCKSPWIVGGEKTLSAIRGYIRDEHVGIIGIYGMGGIGKTTFLAEINNQFLAESGTHDFDVVIFVTISKEVNINKIQEDISLRLGYCRRDDGAGCRLPENIDDRRDTLFRALVHRKFLVLLDDLWKKLDLENIGIPRPNTLRKSGNQKIVFTTRFEEVCADMDAQRSKVRVDLLDEDESWELFCSKMDARLDLENNLLLKPVAKKVVEKCGGLPLALITVGRAMSNATGEGEWNQAKLKLSESPNKLRGMEEDVLSILKFTLERLEDKITMQCLLYCSIFPEDYSFEIKQLVDYWVGEGFLDAEVPDSGSFLEARDKGESIIRKLRDSCLLESGEDEDKKVKMHDVVREMAIWLTGEEFEGDQRFIVCGDKGLTRLEEVRMWTDAKRISVIQEDVLALPSPRSECPNLLTILISSTFTDLHRKLSVSPSLFVSMPALRVLDLSGTSIEKLPDTIGMLGELRYLNLSMTGLKELPKELGKLVKLRKLELRSTDELLRIPLEAIQTLTRLQTLDLHDSGYKWDAGVGGMITFKDLEEGLGRLEDLSVMIRSLLCLVKVSYSRRLQKCTRQVKFQRIRYFISDHLTEALDRLNNLQSLGIEECQDLKMLKVDCDRQLAYLKELSLSRLGELKDVVGVPTPAQRRRVVHPPLFPLLRRLEISYCHRLDNLSWSGQLPYLEMLNLSHCNGMGEILLSNGRDEDIDSHSSSFLKLTKMTLSYLPCLTSISEKTLRFPSLKMLGVTSCPRLRRIPFGTGGHERIRKIEAAADWWDALEWGDCDDNGVSLTKAALAPFFEPLLESDTEEPSVAKQVVKKCGGLPLALITVGRAMSTATSVGEWRQAALMLKETPNKLRGMEDVLSILRFSLEKLEDRISVRCLLYCSIFPEDYNFEMDQLIDYWICEGFLDTEVPESDSLLEARQKGRGIIEKLRNACLLEDGEDEDEVKMHDVVREMALWLTGDEEYMGRNERSIVCGEKGLERLQEVGTWTGAKRISMMQDDVHALPFPESECSNLSTALLGGKFVNPFEELSIPPGLFESMPAIRVLDLSHTSIKELPDAIGSLGELRYLNLSLTSLRRLPKELGRLAKLRNLDLRYTDELLDIPEEAFLTLRSLQALDLHDCGYMWNAGEGGGITLEGLENHLERLEELSVSICSVSCLVTLSNLERLRRCVWEVQLQQVEDLTWDLNLSETLERLNLQVLRLERCPELQMLKVDYGCNQFRRLRTMVLRSLVKLEMVTGGTETTQGDGGEVGGSVPCPPLFPLLRDLDITYCNRLSDLRWAGRLPHLEWIHLSSCKGIEKLLHDDEQGDDGQDPLFPKLMRLTLDNLPALRSISSRRLLFPSLKVLWVERCPRLKRLPVGDDGGLKNIRKIGGEARWWDALEWDDCDVSGVSHTKATLAPFFRPQPEPEPSTSEDEI